VLKKTLLDKLSTHPRTTIVCVLVQHGQAWIAHAGDSRGYLIRAGQLIARTRDHSKLQYLLDTGKIKPSEVTADHPDRNRLINCLGSEVYPAVDHIGPFTLMENDTVLLCSDGVWGTLSDTEVYKIISHPDLAAALPKLVEKAWTAGGEYADDATAMAMRWLVDTPAENSIIDSATMDSAFESTMHLTLTQDSDIRMMSDDEIDATIAEINQALDKLNKHQ
jgi:PPM family protein phosphatase